MNQERKIWMVWVAGSGSPKRMHETFESAEIEAKRLKENTTREIYVFESVFILPGRKVIMLKKRPDACKVEPKT